MRPASTGAGPQTASARGQLFLASAAAGAFVGLLDQQERRAFAASCCGSHAPPGSSPAAIAAEVEKPDTHRHRSYSHVALDNGMQVLLASDPACDKAAAALCVGVGRLHEPKDIPGLAHFCEHMLFLGTEAFPDEAEYKRFLKGHGGKCNAATGESYTCYVFDVAPSHLTGALDRFSQFFVAPLFTASATERELHAVDSEHSMRLTDDGRRSYATLLLDANPRHPLHWGSGNLRSLRDAPRAAGRDPHKEVVAFYTEHYSAADMTLAVLGREPLPELREMVESRFGGVRASGRRALRGDEHGGEEVAITPGDFAGLVLRAPSKDVRSVSFTWQLPTWQVPFWESKPGAYAAHVVGHEGAGSLLAALKARGLATGLSAGVDDMRSFSTFEVTIRLTERGLDHVEEVGELLFQFLRLVRASPVEPWVLREMQQLREIRFRFADDAQPYNLVNVLARNLQDYPAGDVLAGPSKLPRPDPAAALDVVRRLNVAGVRVELVAKRLAGECTDTDPWYQGRFARKTLDTSWMSAWSAALGEPADGGAAGNDERIAAERQAARAGMRLPRPNPFVPEALSARDLEIVSAAPQELARTSLPAGIVRVYHRQDDRFRQPKSVVSIRFRSPAAAQDAASVLRSKVWCSAIMESLNEYLYDARAAGLSCQLSAVQVGMELSVSGFSEKLPLLVQILAKSMRGTSSVSPDVFAIVRDRYMRALSNTALKQRPCDLAARKAAELRESLRFPPEEQLRALQSLQLADLEHENLRLLSGCQVEMLVEGDMTAGNAEELAAVVGRELEQLAAPSALPVRAEAALPLGYTVWHLDGTNVEERNNNVRLEIQLPLSTETYVYGSLFARLLGTKFFEELRTKEQLGYIVQMSAVESHEYLTVVCTVQTEFPPDYVRSRIDAFFDTQFEWLNDHLDEKEFLRQREGLVSNLAEAPKNLREEFSRHWAEIAREDYDFGRRERRAEAVGDASLPQLRSFARSAVAAAPRLYVQVRSVSGGAGKPPPPDAAPARDPDRAWRGDEEAREHRARARWTARGAEVPARPQAPAARL